jgi:4-amino-4-deoxy-L-arabinose transferase-like glycosyltransferase
MVSQSLLTSTDRHATNQPQPSFSCSWRLGAILFLLAVLPRLVAVVAVPGRWLEGRTGDEAAYWGLADSLLETGVYGGIQGDNPQRGVPDAYLPPMYPLLLAGTALLTGHSLVAVDVVQAGLGALACVFAFYVAVLVYSDRRVAWLAFAANAMYPVLLLWGRFHLTETLYIFFLTALTLCLTLTLKQYRARYALWAGGLFALTLLTREALVFWLPFVLIFWLLDRFDWRKKGMALASFLLGTLLVLAPWWVRNVTILDRMVFLTERMDRSVADLLGFVTPFALPWESAEDVLPAPSSASDDAARAACSAGAVYGAILGRNVPPGMERSPAETCCKYRAILRSDVSIGESLSLLAACFVETWLHPSGLWSVPRPIWQTLYLAVHAGMMAVGLVGVVLSLKRRLAWSMLLMLIYGTLAHVTRGALPRYVLPYMPMVFIFVAWAVVLGYDASRWRRRFPSEDLA